MARTMPTPVMHLALADELLSGEDLPADVCRLLVARRGAFLLGNTAPDVQTVSGQSRFETHFYHVPRKTDVPAHEALFARYPYLADPQRLMPSHVAFLAGYLAHVLLDELWLEQIFLRYFEKRPWSTRYERHFVHNVLRAWLDRRDQRRLDGELVTALKEAEPEGWLPFVDDAFLRRWRDWLVDQLRPGRHIETVEVFAQRMGVPPEEMEALLSSPQEMEERVFARVPRQALDAFQKEGYARTAVFITRYVRGELLPVDRPEEEVSYAARG